MSTLLDSGGEHGFSVSTDGERQPTQSQILQRAVSDREVHLEEGFITGC